MMIKSHCHHRSPYAGQSTQRALKINSLKTGALKTGALNIGSLNIGALNKSRIKKTAPQTQAGNTLVEFTIISALFFILLFGIIEFGRLLFTWHLLNETSRRAARIAVVCQVSTTEQQDAKIASLIGSVPLPNFSVDNLDVRYLDKTGTPITADLMASATFNQIEFIEARIINYQLQLMIPLSPLGLTFTAPAFSTLMPRESLGVTRTGFTDC